MLKPLIVTVVTDDGNLHTRKYVPGDACPMSQQEYGEFALGNLIALVVSGHVDTLDIGSDFLGVSYGNCGLGARAGEHEKVGMARTRETTVTGWAVEIVRGA